ncbi:hypothetical protein MLD38_025876 [Melastoma candidum]|uniref:Uncharacterized protein n=1 Tax=Melastoma candidum TaxID=119954 RepID=A0ACB9NWP9_9MYRT|nr:hypothetical protein MLD38_025876 [Melastoma candidum]
MKSISLLMLVVSVYSAHASFSPLLGVHPLDEKYYEGEVIECRDGLRSFARDRLNDDFCDCLDGTDEPGTAACPLGKFYCKNLGSMPKFIPSTHVKDHVCDCCDGSDEYGGGIRCPNTCIMGGNVEYKLESHDMHTQTSLKGRKEKEVGSKSEDFLLKVKGLKTAIMLQVVLIFLLLVLCLCRRHPKGKRRHARASAGHIVGS